MFDVELPKKKNKRVVNKKNNKTNNFLLSLNKNTILIGTVIIIIIILIFAFLNRYNDNYNNVKVNRTEYLVYSKYENNGQYKKFIPYINVKGNNANLANYEIDEFTKEYKEKDASIMYEYSLSGKILSVIIMITDYSDEYAPSNYFRSYNINLDTLKTLSDDELFTLFNTNNSNVNTVVSSTFKNYYSDLVNEKYYTEDECDYNCFLKYRGITDYTENISLYVEGGDLYVFVPFTTYSIFGEEEYFDNSKFKIKLVTSEKN